MSPTIDENSIYMYTLKYIMERGEVEGGDRLATVKAMTGVLHPWSRVLWGKGHPAMLLGTNARSMIG